MDTSDPTLKKSLRKLSWWTAVMGHHNPKENFNFEKRTTMDVVLPLAAGTATYYIGYTRGGGTAWIPFALWIVYPIIDGLFFDVE